MQTRAFIVLSARECSTYVGDLELVRLLQEFRERLDELARGYVFHSVYVFVDQRKVLLHSRDRETYVKRLTSILARLCDFY